MKQNQHEDFMRMAISWAGKGKAAEGGGAFGAVIVKDGSIIAEGHNRVGATTDCTQHAELAMIQEACKKLGSKSLKGCVLYTSCEPCLMCLGSTRWAELDMVYYGASAADAKAAGYVYSDLFYNSHTGKRHVEFNLKQLLRDEAVAIWNS
ncbi:nucleoside deaminase [Leeuwenhoekiella parthenopeia]|uniref:Nucleoside deaminase n=1 Tax=Leeuwenhoekiella parthenopeia TaxID=2890320 RepID=A0ABS8GUC2_9FLAO|nr:nucleoside deaminase [Leeuwenhoekiella parthenopeia]MCC4212701.1 nucleoside deaminase [Leeuwenhoekiella parthenopeia]